METCIKRLADYYNISLYHNRINYGNELCITNKVPVVINENMEIDPDLPAVVYEYIETVRPIGATVTVESPKEKIINIAANISLDGSASMEDVKAEFASLAAEYFRNATFDFYTIGYAKIGSLLLSVPGVADYSGLLLNGDTKNIIIGEDEMPILDDITLAEV